MLYVHFVLVVRPDNFSFCEIFTLGRKTYQLRLACKHEKLGTAYFFKYF